MLCERSVPLTPAAFLDALVRLDEIFTLDAFTYSADASVRPPHWIIGVNTTRELIVKAKTETKAIRDFAFSNKQPTLGFLTYDYGCLRYQIPSYKDKASSLGVLRKYAAYVYYDPSRSRVQVVAEDPCLLDEIICVMTALSSASPLVIDFEKEMKASLSQEAYIEAVNKTIQYIHDGDTYQLNLSIAFNAWGTISSEVALFVDLFKKYPATHYAYLKQQSQSIISTSPETFLRVRNGEVCSMPIKGTLAIEGKVVGVQAEKLRDTEKEAAELSMIVDLIRNDVAMHCKVGSVCVGSHKSIFQVDDLLHMYTPVMGRLKHASTVVDLLIDAFPGGSVTGFPKERSMSIIEKLEPHARGPYCGSLFVIWDEQNIDASVAIRTASYEEKTGCLRWFSGSGITRLSDPAAEYIETLNKSKKFRALLEKENW